MEDSGEAPGSRVGDSAEGASPGVGNRYESVESDAIDKIDRVLSPIT